MGKFIICTFALLGAVFYQMSGGADFEPELRAPVAVAKTELAPVDPTPITVARADTTTLIEIAAPAAQPRAAIAAPAIAASPAAYTGPLPAGEVIITPAPQAVIEQVVAAAAAPLAPINDIRAVAGARVNMRSGPSTDYRVLDTLPRGTKAEVLEVNADGWARVRLMQTGQEGWMAERLLTEG